MNLSCDHEQLGYDVGHICDVSSQLWQHLTQLCGEPVTKKTIQAVLRRQVQKTAYTTTDVISFDITNRYLMQNQEQSISERHSRWADIVGGSVFYDRDQEGIRIVFRVRHPQT